MSAEEDLGLIRLDAGEVTWRDRAGNGWTVAVQRIAVIGEWIDDDGISITTSTHQLVLVDLDQGSFFAPIGSAGFDFLRSEISSVLPECDIDISLLGSTRASRIIWPKLLSGNELFCFVPIRPRSLFEALTQFIVTRVDVQLSSTVLAEIERRRSAHSL